MKRGHLREGVLKWNQEAIKEMGFNAHLHWIEPGILKCAKPQILQGLSPKTL